MKIATIFLLVVTLNTTIHSIAQPKEKPNVLLIITDQQTADAMSCAGNLHIKTPAMDGLAESGVRFTNNYVSQPLCLPWRSSLQTGRYPHEIGTINNGFDINGDYPLLGNLMSEAGYQCDYIGKWHVGTSPGKAGYPDYDNVGKDPEKTKTAAKFLLKKHEKPFFLTVSLMNPHNVCQLARGQELPDGPIGTPPSDLNELPPLPNNFDVPENEPTVIREIQERSKAFHYPTEDWGELEWRQYLWGYYRLVEKVDAQIGQILDALEKGGHENTVIIFTSDHGEGVAQHHWNQKQILYDQSVKTPLIINWKGKTKHRAYKELVSNAIDIPVTLYEIAGIKNPKGLPGQSLLPVLLGKSPKPHDFVISETMFARGATNLGATGRMIRTKKFKYCIYDNGEKREQLFNMENDSGEMVNLAYDGKYKDELNKQRQLITDWAKKTNDDAFPYIAPE